MFFKSIPKRKIDSSNIHKYNIFIYGKSNGDSGLIIHKKPVEEIMGWSVI